MSPGTVKEKTRNFKKYRNDAGMYMKTKDRAWRIGNEAGMWLKLKVGGMWQVVGGGRTGVRIQREIASAARGSRILNPKSCFKSEGTMRECI
jgi:hypothetical protein